MTAEIEGDFVVFLIGMRINKIWKVHRWLPVFQAMPRMIRELQADLDKLRAGDAASIYSGMPPFGLGTVGRLVPAGRGSASLSIGL
ncbi:MAG: hypothetical protein ER33_09045 [Cyanobium sp. CACIAM 14]|nr:MAG: hypothetical protein ER33_09045 [Cyanobium sp. CACIAM 14]